MVFAEVPVHALAVGVFDASHGRLATVSGSALRVFVAVRQQVNLPDGQTGYLPLDTRKPPPEDPVEGKKKSRSSVPRDT